MRLKGSGNYSSRDPSASRAQTTLVQRAGLKPEKVLAPRYGSHPELATFGFFASSGRFWPRGSWLLQCLRPTGESSGTVSPSIHYILGCHHDSKTLRKHGCQVREEWPVTSENSSGVPHLCSLLLVDISHLPVPLALFHGMSSFSILGYSITASRSKV